MKVPTLSSYGLDERELAGALQNLGLEETQSMEGDTSVLYDRFEYYRR